MNKLKNFVFGTLLVLLLVMVCWRVSACDHEPVWLNIPSANYMEPDCGPVILEKMRNQKTLHYSMAVGLCLQMQKQYTGEARCRQDMLQVECR